MRIDRAGRVLGLSVAALLAGAARTDAQALPFAAGESCVYRGSSRLGRRGRGVRA